MSEKPDQQALETRMLSGEPFTYGGLCEAYGVAVEENKSRLIDRTIQKLRRKGLIAYRRERGAVVWMPLPKAPPHE